MKHARSAPPLLWLLAAGLALSLWAPAEIYPSSRLASAALAALLSLLLARAGWQRAWGQGGAVLAAAAGQSCPGPDRLAQGALAVACALGLSATLSLEPYRSVHLLVMLGTACAFYLACRREVRPHLVLWLGIFVAISAVVAVLALLQAAGGLQATLEAALASEPDLPEAWRMRLESGRVFGTLLLPATLGGLMAMAAPVALGLARQGHGAARLLALAGATLALVALVLSRSYGALGAGAIATLWATGRLPRRRAVVLRVGVLVLALILAGLFASARRQSSGQQLLEPQGPIHQRWLNWKTAAAITARYPVLGAGPGAYASAFVSARQPGENDTRYAHSTPLQAVAEMGLWVLLPLGSGLWLLRRRLGQALDGSPVEAGAAVGLMSFVVHNLLDFTAYLPSTLWAALALAAALPDGAATRGAVAGPSSAGTGAPSARLRAALLVGLAAACVMALWPAGRQWKAEQLREGARLAARAQSGDGEARRLYAEAVRCDPLRAELHLEYAAFLLASGPQRAEEALRQARAAARADRGSAQARVLSATALAARGEWAEAYVEAAAATRIHPHSKQARSALERLEAYLDARAP